MLASASERLREGEEGEEGEEGYSEEEEDGLDDFVVEDDEGDDVSSAIREIFGYDKRRYVYISCTIKCCIVQYDIHDVYLPIHVGTPPIDGHIKGRR